MFATNLTTRGTAWKDGMVISVAVDCDAGTVQRHPQHGRGIGVPQFTIHCHVVDLIWKR